MLTKSDLRPKTLISVYSQKTILVILLIATSCLFEEVSSWNDGKQTTKPHIIFILADDVGWNDVSFHGSPQIPTPNLDAFAYDGVILNNYYVQPICTPSRSALLTGMYPFHTGTQDFPIRTPEPWGLPLHFKLLPQWLKELGYATHIVGKWHLGYFKKEYTPTYRGFDSHYGYWAGSQDYYDHSVGEKSNLWGYDLRHNMEPVTNETGHYATELFTSKAQEVIQKHDKSKPLFLYLAHLAVHAGNTYDQLQAPAKYVVPFNGYISNLRRKIYAGMVAALDDSFGQLVRTLKNENMLQNCILVFSSDNGAALTNPVYENEGSNWPLRGAKGTLYEGGVRAAAFAWSPLFKKPGGRVSNHLMHITDWLPTIYEAIGGNLGNLKGLDGVSVWSTLSEDVPSPRKELPVNLNQKEGTMALIQGRYKLVKGFSKTFDTNCPGWHGDSGRDGPLAEYLPLYDVCQAEKVLEDFRKQSGSMNNNGNEKRVEWSCPKDGKFIIAPNEKWNARAKYSELHCKDQNLVPCDKKYRPCLFDMEADPCERHDIAEQNPQIVAQMIQRIEEYNRTAVPVLSAPADPEASPLKTGLRWSCWKDRS